MHSNTECLFLSQIMKIKNIIINILWYKIKKDTGKTRNIGILIFQFLSQQDNYPSYSYLKLNNNSIYFIKTFSNKLIRFFFSFYTFFSFFILI